VTDDESTKPATASNEPDEAHAPDSPPDGTPEVDAKSTSEVGEAPDSPRVVDTNVPAAMPSTENLADDAPRGSEPEVARAVDAAAPPEKGAPSLPAEEPQDALFEALWKRVLESWDDDKPHVAILEHAVRNERMPELAGRYRAQKEVPGREERAKKKLDGIIVAATQMLMATKTDRSEKAPWQLTAAVGVICVLVLVWVAFKVFGVH
jgi:hypothetical protein